MKLSLFDCVVDLHFHYISGMTKKLERKMSDRRTTGKFSFIFILAPDKNVVDVQHNIYNDPSVSPFERRMNIQAFSRLSDDIPPCKIERIVLYQAAADCFRPYTLHRRPHNVSFLDLIPHGGVICTSSSRSPLMNAVSTSNCQTLYLVAQHTDKKLMESILAVTESV